MTWTAPRTWVYAELVTTAMMNQQIRDNMLALYPYTAQGDIAYRGASDELIRHAIGTITGQVLRTNSGLTGPEWGSPLVCFDYFTYGSNVNVSGGWVDVPSVSKDITVPSDCSLLAMIQFRARSYGSGNASAWRLNIDGNAGNDVGRSESALYVPHSLMQIQSVAAGTRTIKLQANNDSSCTAYSQDHHMLVFGLVMP